MAGVRTFYDISPLYIICIAFCWWRTSGSVKRTGFQAKENSMKLSHIALSLLVLTPLPAFAQQVTSSVAVSYGDLNLRSDAGVKALDRRLAIAVRAVCGAHDGSAVVAFRFAAQRCVKEKSAEVAALRASAIAGYSAA